MAARAAPPPLMPARAPSKRHSTDGSADRSAGELPATLAHEIRGPLMALATSAELLMEDAETLDRGQIRDMARAIHTRALWLQGLVENLLCASALRSGRFRVHPQPHDISDLVDEVKLLLDPLLWQRKQPLRVRRPRHGAPQAMADSRRLSQVLVNLVLNASKFAPEGTPIEVILATSAQGVRISVADRGPGLPPGGATALFEPFHRAAATSHVDGVGLGLAIARAIVEAHGGRIGANNRPGGGAVFWVDLPPLPTPSHTA
jgi:two-component system sensor histidine kinase KdpD